MIMIIMVEEEDKEAMEEEIREEEVMEKDFKEVMEVVDVGVIVEEDLEMVEEEEAMVPKIAKILNVNKSILREELEEV